MKLTLAPIFQSNMVLQREKPLPIWGSAPKDTILIITLASIQTTTLSDGSWRCTLPPQKAGTDYVLQVFCFAKETDTKRAPLAQLTLTNLSIGDVWLACGQSNMEFFLRYDADWDSVKQYEKNPHIHMYNVPQLAFSGHEAFSRPKEKFAGYGCWFTEGDTGFETFSAPAYSFARNLQPKIDVPVGIIGCNWGGTTASAWLDENYLKEEPLSIYLKEYEEALKLYSPEELEKRSLEGWKFEDSAKHAEEFMPLLYGRDRAWQEAYMKEHENDPVIPLGPWNINRPAGLYHQMLKPLIPFAIKGVLWYQGESDAIHATIYDKLLSALITCWRHNWNDDFPFLFVQLAPFGVWLQCDSNGYTQVRRKQEFVSQTVPNTGMVSIMDIGSYYDIHPKQKLEVGRRLALLAEGKVYGHSILCESPRLHSICRKKESYKQLVLTFDNCGTLHCSEEKISGFVLLQQGKEIPITTLQIEGAKLLLEADALTDAPCEVKFAWADYAVVNLYNEADLPIRPFITQVP